MTSFAVAFLFYRWLLARCGTAACGGLPAAVADLIEVERAGGYGLCKKVEPTNTDLRKFEVDDQ